MSHSFEIKKLPNNVTLMVCKCGLTYRYSVSAESWYQVPFRNNQGSYTEPPTGQCGETAGAEDTVDAEEAEQEV